MEKEIIIIDITENCPLATPTNECTVCPFCDSGFGDFVDCSKCKAPKIKYSEAIEKMAKEIYKKRWIESECKNKNTVGFLICEDYAEIALNALLEGVKKCKILQNKLLIFHKSRNFGLKYLGYLLQTNIMTV